MPQGGGGMAPGGGGGLPNRGVLPGGMGTPQNYPQAMGGAAGHQQLHAPPMRGMGAGGPQGGPPQHQPPPQQQGYPRFPM